MHLIAGIVIAVIAGTVNGLFALPMKLARRWNWENVWLPFSILGLVLFPRLLAIQAVPHLENAYAHAGFSTLLIPFLWGIVVYSGALMFGRSIVYIGTGLAFALLVGSMSIVGVLTPILIYSPGALSRAGGHWILAGMTFLFAALIGCARAGTLKARNTLKDASSAQAGSRSSAILGMAMAVGGGTLSGLLSLGLNTEWAHRISDASIRFGGAGPSAATSAVLVLVLCGGAIPNCLYCLYLLNRNGTWKAYRGTGAYWLIIVLMASMYSGSTVLWGVSTSVTMLGRLGPSIGWALFIGSIAVSSNIGGFITGEWKGAGTKASGLMITGLLLMVAAMVLVGYGNLLLNG